MDVLIDISKNIKDQFVNQFDLVEDPPNTYSMNASLGSGGALSWLEFPGQLEFYHFGATRFRRPIRMKSINPSHTDWYLIHVNLARVKQEKFIGDHKIDFQRHLPIGMLLYGPDLEIVTEIPQDIESELASIRFSRSFLTTYFEHVEDGVQINKSLTYEDLNTELETRLLSALKAIGDKMRCHALILDFMKVFFEKLKRHDSVMNLKKLHPEDLNNLFRVCAQLRDPTAAQVPSLNDLAAQANMGLTKFKVLFKQVFGKSPMGYRNKIRMEFAKKALSVHGKTPSEVSHDLGYAHPSSFTVAYKKYFGELPSTR